MLVFISIIQLKVNFSVVKSKNERKQYIRISKGLVRKKSAFEEHTIANSNENITPEYDEDNIENEPTPGPSSEASEALALEIQETVNKFLNLETSMCDRRRLLYAETPISIVLEGGREWVSSLLQTVLYLTFL